MFLTTFLTNHFTGYFYTEFKLTTRFVLLLWDYAIVVAGVILIRVRELLACHLLLNLQFADHKGIVNEATIPDG
jgi:hypothetical protein